MTESVSIEGVIERIKEISDSFAETLSPDGDWEPTFFLIKDSQIRVSIFPMPPNDMRDFFFESVLPNQIRPQEPDAVIILVSTWMAVEDDPEKIKKGEFYPPPSQRPDRKEALIIQGVSRDEEVCVMAEIIRSDGPPELEWEDLPEDTAMEGRMLASLRRGVWG